MPAIDTDKVYKDLVQQNGRAVAELARTELLLDIPNICKILKDAGSDVNAVKQLIPAIRQNQIKKQNGEAVSHVIRDAILLDIPNIIHILQYAGRDPVEVRNLVPIIREIYKQTKPSAFQSNESPLELLRKAGYDAWVVTNEEEKNRIAKYYRENERICTLNDPHRHENYFMIHAVKFNADDIKPSDTPQREDEYGTSVISIQIAKPKGGFISIKNRYNHTVPSPDSTFNNDPDRIYPGLSDSLKRFFHVDFNTTGAQIPNNFIIVHDQLVRYDYEINNVYFGPDYYVEGSTITKLNNDNQLLFFQGFVLTIAKGNNTVKSVAGENKYFCKALSDFLRDKKVSMTTSKDGTKTKTIAVNGRRFMDIKDGRITFIDASEFKIKTAEKDENGNPVYKSSAIQSVIFNSAGTELVGDLDFSGVNSLTLSHCNLKNVSSIKLNPQANQIYIHDNERAKLSGDLDFSGVKHLQLNNVDLTDVKSIKLNPSVVVIRLAKTQIKLHGILDFSNAVVVELGDTDLTNVTSIKLNPELDSLIINNVKLAGNLSFSKATKVEIGNADLSNVKSAKFNGNVKLKNTKLAGDLDFSTVSNLDIDDCDLSNVTSIKLNPHAQRIHISNSPFKLVGDVDFSHVNFVELDNGNLSEAHVKFGRAINATTVKLTDCKLGGDIEFVGKSLNIKHCDATNVTSLNLHPYTEEINLTDNTGLKLSGDLDFCGVKHLDLGNTDLTNVTRIHFPDGYDYANRRHATYVGVHGIKPPSCGLNLEHVDYIELSDTDLTQSEYVFLNDIATSVKLKNVKLRNWCYLWNVSKLEIYNCEIDGISPYPEAEYIHIEGTSLKFPNKVNLSKVKDLELYDCDLSDAESVSLNPNGSTIILDGCKLKGPIDLGSVSCTSLTNADLNKVPSIKLPYSPVISGVKSENPLELDFTRTAGSLNDMDLTGLKNVKLKTQNHRLLRCKNDKFAGTWYFDNLESLEMEKCVAPNMKFHPNITHVEITESALCGDLDLSMVKAETILRECDLTNVKSFKFNPNPTERWGVYLWKSIFAGDLDFMDGPEFIALMDTDFTKVKSIKLSNKQYKNIKNQDVVMNGKKMLFKDLAKHGIEIIRPNIFRTAKQKIDDLKLRVAQRKVQDSTQAQQNSSSGQSH
ncbi:MAG: hypothetical protein J6W40_00250 [Alphaproteobacteria bacterium]|nr:hypothetical protein [Alphaproteobacteria bacterium]